MTAFLEALNWPVGRWVRRALDGLWRAVSVARRAMARGLALFAGDGRVAALAELATDALIARFQQGHPQAFDVLYERYKDYVYRVAFFVARHREEAEDAVQETFLDVLRALPDYDVDGPARFETWLYRVTLNRTRTRFRRKRPPSVEWDDVEEHLERLPVFSGERPESVLLDQERAQELWRAVGQLSDLHREVIILRYQCDLSYAEIAETLDVRLGTVKSRLYNAHKHLLRLF